MSKTAMGIGKRLSAMIFLAGLYDPAFAQQPAPSPPAHAVIASVFDARGNAIRNLKKESFRVSLNSKPGEIASARYTLAPRRTVIVLDMSGSMIDESHTGKWPLAIGAAQEFLSQAPAEAQIGLLSFSGGLQDVFDLTQRRDAISNRLATLRSEGPNHPRPAKTALLDTIGEALKMLQPSQPGDSIYAITDAEDNASRVAVTRLQHDLYNSGTRLFALRFVESLPSGLPQEETSASMVMEMVLHSGGYSFPIAGQEMPSPPRTFNYSYDKGFPEKIKEYTRTVHGMIDGFWALQFAGDVLKNSKVRVEIVGPDARPRKDVGVIYQHSLPDSE